PDGHTYSAPVTFDTRGYADAWLSRVSADIQRGKWESPDSAGAPSGVVHPVTFSDYAAGWLAGRDPFAGTPELLQILLRAPTPPRLRGRHRDRDHPGDGAGVARGPAHQHRAVDARPRLQPAARHPGHGGHR